MKFDGFIDTHCHLDAAEFDPDRDTQRRLARQAGVRTCVIPAVARALSGGQGRGLDQRPAGRGDRHGPVMGRGTLMISAASLPATETVITWSEALTRAAIQGGIAVGIAIAVHFMVFAILGRASRFSASEIDDLVFARLRRPVLFSMVAVAISIAAESNALIAKVWHIAGRFVEPALFGWVLFTLVKAFAMALEARTAHYEDEMEARSRRTRIAIFSRTAGFLIVFMTVALVLFGIPAVRSIGTTLLASAGVISLAFGVAAQPALKSLIAGIQIAITEPIRIGDFVVVEGENGRVEDIRLSYVVIRDRKSVV